MIRDELPFTELDDQRFWPKVQEVESALVRLGVFEDDIRISMNLCMEPERVML